MTQSKMEKHLEALKAKHSALDAEIEVEMARPLPDDVKISGLKKQKLKIKEEIQSIEDDNEEEELAGMLS